jgi:hypothetical protein
MITYRNFIRSLFISCLFYAGNFICAQDEIAGTTPSPDGFKKGAVSEINSFLKDKKFIPSQKDLIKKKNKDKDEGGESWFTENYIQMKSGEWMIYSSSSSSENPLAGDVFICRGSDGKWYESGFKFTKNLSVLIMFGQPENLKTFLKEYEFKPFSPIPSPAKP